MNSKNGWYQVPGDNVEDDGRRTAPGLNGRYYWWAAVKDNNVAGIIGFRDCYPPEQEVETVSFQKDYLDTAEKHWGKSVEDLISCHLPSTSWGKVIGGTAATLGLLSILGRYKPKSNQDSKQEKVQQAQLTETIKK